MKKTKYLISLGVAAATGTAVGLLSSHKRPVQNGILGAIAGTLASLAITELYRYTSDNYKAGFYSKSSRLYDSNADIDYI